MGVVWGVFWEWEMVEGVEVERGGVALGVLESFLASRGVSSQPASPEYIV